MTDPGRTFIVDKSVASHWRVTLDNPPINVIDDANPDFFIAHLCDKSYDRVSLASPISFRSQPGQTYLFVWHRRSGRDIRFGIFQGQAQRPSQTAAPAGRQSQQTRPVGGTNPPEHHINNVNAYHGRLKEWVRRFHGVATKNLPSYLSWRRTIEALGAATTPEAWIMGAAGMGPNQHSSRL